MEIKTKFNVGDLLKHKDSTECKNARNVFRVMEVHAQVCYSTVQVFYHIRPIIVMKVKDGYGADAKFHYEVAAAFGKDDNSLGWQKYREDELIKAEEDTIGIINKSL